MPAKQSAKPRKKTVKTKPPENPSAFKHWIGVDLLGRIGRSLHALDPQFDSKKLLGLRPQLEALELKPRVRLIREALRKQLPADYAKALELLLQSTRDGTLTGFDLWPYSDFIQTYGLEDPKRSLTALKEMTELFSSEFAVRPFLARHSKLTFAFLKECAQDPSEHIRRWASEGSRPRLPWGERLQDLVKDPTPTLPLLELLKDDAALYVRKSVANHLNDIAKDHPERVLILLKNWNTTRSKNLEWITRHALRTLIKNGHPEALALIGVESQVKIEVSALRVTPKKIKVGGALHFDFLIRSLEKKEKNLVIDYLIHFVKSNGKTAPKVFKLKKVILPPFETVSINKRHEMKKVTTRVFYPGKHALEVQVNGQIVARSEWILIE